jgi:fibronectin type 3 domain-containing protein
VGYNEYRGTTLGSYSKLNASPVAGTTYTDATVQSGQGSTYYYVVTAVNSSGVESAQSSPANVTVP